MERTKAPKYNPQKPLMLQFHKAVPNFLDCVDTPRDYLERCLDVIEQKEPKVAAWVCLAMENARAAADASTKRYKRGQPRSLLDGCPMAIKDIIETIDMPTQMNSGIYEGWQSKSDAAAVYALRKSGAVILGKTVTTEFATGAAGPTTNPFDHARTPGGSSSGTAAAVGCGMVPAGLGTQTAGSVVRPAAYCGAFGFKPTHASLNMGGIHPISNTHDTLGTIAGSIEDCWRVAHRIAETVGGTAPHPGISGPEKLGPGIKPSRLIRLYTDGWAEVEGTTQNGFEDLLLKLEESDIEIIDNRKDSNVAELESLLKGVGPLARTITQYERRWPFEHYYEQWKDKLSQELRKSIENAKNITHLEYCEAIGQREKIRRKISCLRKKCDGFITLTAAGPAPLGLKNTGNRSFQIAWTLTAAPCFTLPLLNIDGLPTGIQLMSFPDNDKALALHAKWVAQALLT